MSHLSTQQHAPDAFRDSVRIEAVDLVESVLPIFCEVFPKDNRVAVALSVARDIGTGLMDHDYQNRAIENALVWLQEVLRDLRMCLACSPADAMRIAAAIAVVGACASCLCDRVLLAEVHHGVSVALDIDSRRRRMH